MSESNIAHPPIATQEDWRKARVEILADEKALTKERDRINAKRRRLPMVKVEKEYMFDTPTGPKSLLDLFEERRQLVVYHFMFDPAWDEGCPGCTGFVDALGDLSLMNERDTTFTLVSRAPLAKLEEYKKKHGWNVDWASSFGSDFNYDFHVTLDGDVVPIEYNFLTKAEMESRGQKGDHQGEAPGLSAFFRIGDEVYHTNSVFARGLESLTDSYNLLDITAYGRQEDFEDSPEGWPQKPTYG